MNEQIKTVAGAPLFNPLAPEFIANPYPYYHRLRETDPMHLTPLGFYVASRHADIATVLRDKRFGKDFAGRMSQARTGPKFSRSRSIAACATGCCSRIRPTTPACAGSWCAPSARAAIEDMRPRIQEIVDEIIDHVEARGHMDLIADFAYRLPVTVICDMLGIPEEDRELFFTQLAHRGAPARPRPAQSRRDPAAECFQSCGGRILPSAV